VKSKKENLKESDLIYWYDIWKSKVELGVITKKKFDYLEVLSNNSLQVLKIKYDNVEKASCCLSEEDFKLRHFLRKFYNE